MKPKAFLILGNEITSRENFFFPPQTSRHWSRFLSFFQGFIFSSEIVCRCITLQLVCCAVWFPHSLSKLCWGGCFSFFFLSFLGTDFTVPSSSPCSHFPTFRFRFVGRPLHHYNPSPCSSVIKINTLPLFSSPPVWFGLDEKRLFITNNNNEIRPKAFSYFPSNSGFGFYFIPPKKKKAPPIVKVCSVFQRLWARQRSCWLVGVSEGVCCGREEKLLKKYFVELPPPPTHTLLDGSSEWF